MNTEAGPPEPPVDVEQRAANLLNAVMAAVVGLSVTLLGLWMIFSAIGPAAAVYKSLSDQTKRYLYLLLSGLVLTPTGIRLFWLGTQKIRQSVPRFGA